MSNSNPIERLALGEPARLIPVTNGECRAVSALLGTFRMVPEFANMMLEEVGAPTGKRSKLTAYTEVCFKDKVKGSCELPRPDGLIVVEHGKRVWSALVEAKVKGRDKDNGLSAKQIEQYLEVARDVGAQAVITISNQFALMPTHHPVQVDRKKTKKVDLFHFSWLALLSNANILAKSEKIIDPEQKFVLEELIRFLEHKGSGVDAFGRMGRSWGELCDAIKKEALFGKDDNFVKLAVADWHQLTRYLAIELSTRLHRQVKIYVRRRHVTNPEERMKADIGDLIAHKTFNDYFEIPNAADRIQLTVNLFARTMKLSMSLKPPEDCKRPQTAIRWLAKQLAKAKPEHLRIRCEWPGHTQESSKSLPEVLGDPKSLVPDGMSLPPKCIEVIRDVDVAGVIRRVEKFVEVVEQEFLSFYDDVGQNLRAWTPPPPKYHREEHAAPDIPEDPAPASDSEKSLAVNPISIDPPPSSGNIVQLQSGDFPEESKDPPSFNN